MTDKRKKLLRDSLLVIDANVLYSIRYCDFILTASTQGLLRKPIVSELVITEAFRNLIVERPDLDEAIIARRFAAVRTATNGHDVEVPEKFKDEQIINPKDRHVMAAAVLHKVSFIVTNDDGFHKEIGTWASARKSNIVALKPDELAARMIAESGTSVIGVITEMAQRMKNPRRTPSEVLEAFLLDLPSLHPLRDSLKT